MSVLEQRPQRRYQHKANSMQLDKFRMVDRITPSCLITSPCSTTACGLTVRALSTRLLLGIGEPCCIRAVSQDFCHFLQLPGHCADVIFSAPDAVRGATNFQAIE